MKKRSKTTLLGTDNQNRAAFIMSSSSITSEVDSDALINDNLWRHIVSVYIRKVRLEIWLDGVNEKISLIL